MQYLLTQAELDDLARETRDAYNRRHAAFQGALVEGISKAAQNLPHPYNEELVRAVRAAHKKAEEARDAIPLPGAPTKEAA